MAGGEVVLVTGGAGFLGQHIVYLLQEKTSVSEIRVFDLKEYRNNMGRSPSSILLECVKYLTLAFWLQCAGHDGWLCQSTRTQARIAYSSLGFKLPVCQLPCIVLNCNKL